MQEQPTQPKRLTDFAKLFFVEPTRPPSFIKFTTRHKIETKQEESPEPNIPAPTQQKPAKKKPGRAKKQRNDGKGNQLSQTRLKTYENAYMPQPRTEHSIVGNPLKHSYDFPQHLFKFNTNMYNIENSNLSRPVLPTNAGEFPLFHFFSTFTPFSSPDQDPLQQRKAGSRPYGKFTSSEDSDQENNSSEDHPKPATSQFPKSTSDELRKSKRITVKFVQPNFIFQRKYATWEQISEIGRWAWEAEERPVYIENPDEELKKSIEEINNVKRRINTKKVFQKIKEENNLALFLIGGLPDEWKIEEYIEPKDETVSISNPSKYYSRPTPSFNHRTKHSQHRAINPFLNETDMKVSKFMEYASIYSERVRISRLLRIDVPLKFLFPLFTMAKQLWPNYQISAPKSNLKSKKKENRPSKQTRNDPYFYLEKIAQSIEKEQMDQLVYLGESLNMRCDPEFLSHINFSAVKTYFSLC